MSDILDRLKTAEVATSDLSDGAPVTVSRRTILDAIAEIAQLLAERDAQETERTIREAWVSKLEKDNAQLQAIVDRLPKTTDGVPIAKGTIIYQAAGVHTMLEHEVSGWQFADDGSLKILMFGRGWTAFCDGWYSTREAAEAARTEVGE